MILTNNIWQPNTLWQHNLGDDLYTFLSLWAIRRHNVPVSLALLNIPAIRGFSHYVDLVVCRQGQVGDAAREANREATHCFVSNIVHTTLKREKKK